MKETIITIGEEEDKNLAVPKHDIVIFGATGFIGKAVVAEIRTLIKKYPGMTWAVAGRSKKKLQDMMVELSNKTGEDLSCINIIIADVNNEHSLKNMCKQANVIVNCCGPYLLSGEAVIKAAIERRAHYVDVSGEPQFIETMYLKYHKQAEEAGVYIISACAFDTILHDLGVIFLQKNFGGTLNTVEAYVSASIPDQYQKEVRKHGVLHHGTWKSFIYSVTHMHDLKRLRRKLYPKPLPKFEPKIRSRSVIHKRIGGFCVPYSAAEDLIVYRTQRHLYEENHQRPVQFKVYIKLGSLLQTIFLFLGLAVIYVMTRWQRTRKLLLDHPRLFSCGYMTLEGPTEEVRNNTTFELYLYGEGWGYGVDTATSKPDRKVVAKISGKNPAYGASAVWVLLSAFTILKERSAMPAKGGVLSTGIAFMNTDLITNLMSTGITFDLSDTTTKRSAENNYPSTHV